MPALPPVDGFVRIVCSGTYNTKTWANIFYANVSPGSAISSADLQAIATAVSGLWNTNFAPSLSNLVSLTQVAVTDIGSDTGLTELDTTVHAGSQAGNSASPQVCLLLSWKIARRYRGGHPRTYLPGVIEADVDGAGVVTGARQTALNTACTNWRAGINGIALSGSSPVLSVVHYVKNGVVQSTPTVDDVLSGRCSPLVATQRRRLRS